MTKHSQESRHMTGLSYLKKAEYKRGYKHVKTSLSAEKVLASVFWDSQPVLFSYLQIKQQTMNAAYYSKLLKDRVNPAFRLELRSRSVKSVSLP
jgi:hypothetical protein